MDEHFRQLIKNWKRTALASDENPLRSELLNPERLEEYARLLANEHTKAGPGRGKSLLPRLRKNEHIVVSAYETLSDAVRRDPHSHRQPNG